MVDWRACVDADARNVEVSVGHCHLTTNRATLAIVADAVKRAAAGSHQAERGARAA